MTRTLEISERRDDDPSIRITLTVEEAAALLGVGRAVAYEAVKTGQIPSIRVGRLIRIPRAAFERMLSGVAA